jgi:hypothetical protein
MAGPIGIEPIRVAFGVLSDTIPVRPMKVVVPTGFGPVQRANQARMLPLHYGTIGRFGLSPDSASPLQPFAKWWVV